MFYFCIIYFSFKRSLFVFLMLIFFLVIFSTKQKLEQGGQRWKGRSGLVNTACTLLRVFSAWDQKIDPRSLFNIDKGKERTHVWGWKWKIIEISEFFKQIWEENNLHKTAKGHLRRFITLKVLKANFPNCAYLKTIVYNQHWEISPILPQAGRAGDRQKCWATMFGIIACSK